MCLFLDETDVQRAKKIFWETGSPLSQRLDDQHPLSPPLQPPSLEVWIGHWELACRITFEGLVTY